MCSPPTAWAQPTHPAQAFGTRCSGPGHRHSTRWWLSTAGRTRMNSAATCTCILPCTSIPICCWGPRSGVHWPRLVRLRTRNDEWQQHRWPRGRGSRTSGSPRAAPTARMTWGVCWPSRFGWIATPLLRPLSGSHGTLGPVTGRHSPGHSGPPRIVVISVPSFLKWACCSGRRITTFRQRSRLHMGTCPDSLSALSWWKSQRVGTVSATG